MVNDNCLVPVITKGIILANEKWCVFFQKELVVSYLFDVISQRVFSWYCILIYQRGMTQNFLGYCHTLKIKLKDEIHRI